MDSSYHIPVLLRESIEGLDIRPEGVYVDLTFGGGGHSKAILENLGKGKLFAFDQDAEAEQNCIEDERFTFCKSNFRFFKNFLRYYGIEQVDGILADLGVSSFHFDTSGRGFSFRYDEELDMRMNSRAKLSAKEVINQYDESDLRRIFYQFGELKNSGKIVSAISEARKVSEILSTKQLCSILSRFTPENQENKFFAKVFQAIRIEVNNELGVLENMLVSAADVLKPGGRLSVISYHSLEDRLVKNFIKTGNTEGKEEKDFYGNLINCPLRAVNKKIILAEDEEIKRNNRARSAKLRIAEKIDIQKEK